MYKDPERGSTLQPSGSTLGASTSKIANADNERRSLSPVRAPRRTTTTAVIACRQCRSRKIRCDSTRPHCANCSRRADMCEYDTAPKRRGPDKKPGTRQRRCKTRVDEGENVPQRKLSSRPDSSSGASASASIGELPSPASVSPPDAAIALSTAPQAERPTKRQKVSKREVRTQSLGDLAERVQQQPSRAPAVAAHTYGRAIRPLPPQPHSPSTEQGPLRISTDDAVLLRRTQPSSAQPPSSTRPLSSAHPPSSMSSAQYLGTPSSASYTYNVSPFEQTTGYELGHQPPSAHVDHPQFPGLPSAAVQATQQGWWEAFLRSYTLREIATELNFLFSESSITLSFVNIGFLLETLWSPTKYLTLQPAFVLASMALAVLIRSSETERGAQGRERAAFLRHSAQDALERAWREGMWVDATLAEAALLLALYEYSAHPDYHPDRLARAFVFLDEVFNALGLTAADANSGADVCRYARGAAPVVDVHAGMQCGCIPPGSPPRDADSVWASALPWDPSWDEQKVRDEECRRMCWGALSLVTSFRTECMALGRPDDCAALCLCDPANYLLLFPNELYDRGGFGGGRQDGGMHPKNAIWALFCRSMLLANFCANVAIQPVDSADARETQAEALQEAWHETQAVQDTLDAHSCNLHTAVAYLCRENVSNAQMIITKMLRSLQGLAPGNRPGPLFNRRQAEEWIRYQNEVIQRVTLSIQYLSDPRASPLAQRPFAVPWFYHQLAICLLLWENDTALGEVLELAKLFLYPLGVMNALWPCPLIQQQCTALQKRLDAHCRAAGHAPPAAYALAAVHREA
ncbi:hypothetical protein B0H17DRAFT_1108091 [Mycena rosella]|uniref:Zn(2)-C6 fungal-type domain-containing protein n=1 Tax=Mycena rosella TaxID=1033263 RepID=A0AAD7BXW7_MYCRO|nr:hypothetical protein B0H17DRAFT_1108091 [Mycena rosella]